MAIFVAEEYSIDASSVTATGRYRCEVPDQWEDADLADSEASYRIFFGPLVTQTWPMGRIDEIRELPDDG